MKSIKQYLEEQPISKVMTNAMKAGMINFTYDYINNFISNIDNETYNRIRNSQGNAECRRYLKEKLNK